VLANKQINFWLMLKKEIYKNVLSRFASIKLSVVQHNFNFLLMGDGQIVFA